MASSVTTWRRRCLDAEARAERAERALARAKAKADRCADDADDADAALAEHKSDNSVLRRIVRRLAVIQLGEGASDDEIQALMTKWSTSETKRSKAEDLEAAKRAMRRYAELMGYDPEEFE